jgi:transcriptional regulator with XRE-family HTH domain
LADRIGASQAAIAQWERVEREPSLEKFGQLATATGTDPRCIIFGDEPKSQADGDLVADDRLKRDLILQLIVSVERRLGREYIRLTPEAKARLIIALHDIATTLGGENKVVEADETFVGGKAKNRAYAPPPKKEAVAALVEREGHVRSYHVANVTAETLRPIIVQAASRKSHLMTDESQSYTALGREFAGHSTVNHSANEYVRLGGFVHTNTLEGYFSIVKRGIYGIYQHVSEAHLHRYLTEFDFRYNNRVALGISDAERTDKALEGIVGKRLTYRRPDQTAHA